MFRLAATVALAVLTSLGSCTQATADEPKELSVDLGGVNLALNLIPAGDFVMGVANADRHPLSLTPDLLQRDVSIAKPFYLGKYPVTQEQWQAVMGSNPSELKGPKNPVEQVSWNDCQKFIAKLNSRKGNPAGKFQLPTEEQWEYACRAGSTTRYCFGDDESKLGKYAWYRDNSDRKTHPVGEKLPNAWDLYDMHGNVLEWCDDGCTFNGAPTTDSFMAPAFRVARGGSCINIAEECRSTQRCPLKPGIKYFNLGLRVAFIPAEK